MRPVHRLLLPAVLLTSMLTLPTAAYADHSADVDCGDFATQEAAQEHLDGHPGDSDGLNHDGDGVACEATEGQASPTQPPAPAKPLLSLASAAVIPVGGGQVATVTGGGPGARVDLYAYTLPNMAYKVIRSATLNAQGVATWTLNPGGHTNLYAVVNGVRSDIATMRVARTVTLGVRQAAGVYRFSGAVDRPVGGLQVTLARVLSDGRVVGIGSTRTNGAGAYAISSQLSSGTNLYYVLTGATFDLLPARSRAYGLAVPVPNAPRPVAVQSEHGGIYFAVYLTVASSANDPRIRAALASARRVGYEAYEAGGLECDAGAIAGLRLNPSVLYYAAVLYFRTEVAARQFTALHPPVEAGVVRVQTFCLD